MNKERDDKSSRPSGYYWIRRSNGPVEVAFWGRGVWWLVGHEQERDDEDIRYVYERVYKRMEDVDNDRG